MASSEPPPVGRDTVEGFLAALAADRPAPSGGAAAALGCALGAALAEMAAARCGPGSGVDVRAVTERAAAARATALGLADDDMAAYAEVLAALRLPAADPDRPARVRETLSAAADPPLAIAMAAAEAAELAAEVAAGGNPRLRGDATAGALLAESAAQAAVRLVEIDLAAADGDERIGRARAAAARAHAARERALGLDVRGEP